MKTPSNDCDVYLNEGCTHIDGFLCDYPNCSILNEHRQEGFTYAGNISELGKLIKEQHNNRNIPKPE